MATALWQRRKAEAKAYEEANAEHWFKTRAPERPPSPIWNRYPPHFNADHHPECSTQTALALSRKAEAKGYGQAIGERWAAMTVPVPEPKAKTAEMEPRTCPISHIWQRAEADHQASRVAGGLFPMSMPVNPERELKTVGLLRERVEKPLFATKTELEEVRRRTHHRDCEELRAKGENQRLPRAVETTIKEVMCYEFRRPTEEPVTLTTMKDARRRAKIEYDMANFKMPERQAFVYPKLSDYWDGPGVPAPQLQAMARSASAPVLKVTDVPFADQSELLTAKVEPGPAGKKTEMDPGATVQQMGSNTVKRWTADMLDRDLGRNKPRLFDNIQPARIGPRDLEDLDLTSSMEPIRTNALRKLAQQRKEYALNPRQSRLFRADHSQLSSASSRSLGLLGGPTISKDYSGFIPIVGDAPRSYELTSTRQYVKPCPFSTLPHSMPLSTLYHKTARA